jgi:Na+-translocating ferredoxin:NAD+ oxidoreductase subunit B
MVMPPVAFVRELDCIGCARCLPVCPTDAIVGTLNLMHTVIAADCTGCQRCLPVCPTDCISMQPRPPEMAKPREVAERWRRRYRARAERLARLARDEIAARRRARTSAP